MSPAPLTAEQARAAKRGPGDAVVLAGAGSGKTTVLTARFLHLVRERRLRVRDVAALTFTEKAAGEMRVRIARDIAASEDPEVRRQAEDVEFAPISTIHAFGARLLREHAIEAGVDPAFTLLDEEAARLLLEDAWTTVDRRLRRAGDPRLAVLRRLGGRDAAEQLQRLHERMRGLDLTPDRLVWTRGAVGLADALVDLGRVFEDLDEAVAAKGLKASAQAAFDAARARLPRPEELGVPTLEGVRRAADIAGRGLNAIVPLPTRVATEERKAVPEAYARIAAAMLDELGAREVAGGVVELLAEHFRAYEQAKRALGALDFADLELHVLRLLERLDERGRFLERRPAALLVDEYQDVNSVQARILGRLRRPVRGRPIDQFAVGDPKQSIYRFRRADVGVLLGAYEEAGPEGRTKLTESFRSTPEVVAFHNALFGRLLTKPAAGVEAEAMSAQGAFHPHAPVPVEVSLVDAGPTSGDARHDVEAAAVARRIRAWIDGGEMRWKREKGPDGCPGEAPRPLRWKDVAVLLRARTYMKAYERAFVAAGIPFEVGKGKGFYDTEEIADLVHVLRVVHDPRDRFAVAAWLASPAVGATDEDLLAVCGDPRADAYALAAQRPSLRTAVDRIERLRRLAVAAPLEATVRAAIDDFDAVETSLLQAGGARRARNLRKALAVARRLDGEGGHGLFDFLRRLTDLRDREVEESEAGTAAEGDAVTLSTIHAAKGLEWPCVVLAECGSPGGRRGTEPTFRFDETGGFSARLKDPLEGTDLVPAGCAALKEADDRAQEQESLRLLYVALTRAEERLVVSASVGGTNKDGSPARLLGWGREVWQALGTPFVPGERDVPFDSTFVRVRVEASGPEAVVPAAEPSWFQRLGSAGLLAGELPGLDGAAAAAAWARVEAPREGLGRTPFVVTISDLLAFARSPAAFYAERVVGAVEGARRPTRASEATDPGSGSEGGPDLDAAAAEREERWDEGRDVVDGVDRAALGRAVHLAIERWSPTTADLGAHVAAAVGEEFQDGAPPAVRATALAMVARFLDSATGRAMRDALARGREVRREVAFHARIRFPHGAEVAGLGALLVKGSIDLWIAGADGRVTILDHKTNAPGKRFPTPEALRAHYETQLRLYALAAERVVEQDVTGAGLLLLDPAWGALGAPVELPVDVSGEALERTRRLCQAFAVAMDEDRFPARWETLLPA